MRLPRLERLGAALGLCEFEKNVVVSMIGQAIAPRSIGLMGGRIDGGGSGAPSKTMQVEVLLLRDTQSARASTTFRGCVRGTLLTNGAPLRVLQVLLRAFSHSLQQQIEHRKHFYKSAATAHTSRLPATRHPCTPLTVACSSQCGMGMILSLWRDSLTVA
jgi:hypothetical protein